MTNLEVAERICTQNENLEKETVMAVFRGMKRAVAALLAEQVNEGIEPATVRLNEFCVFEAHHRGAHKIRGLDGKEYEIPEHFGVSCRASGNFVEAVNMGVDEDE